VPARTLVVVNPKSRGGGAGRRFAALEPRLRDALGPLEVERTRGPRDAERIAREGARAGVERIVVAGGDGTAGEVAAGVLGAGLGGACEIGLLPLGTGGDLARTLGLGRDPEAALAALAAGKRRAVDAGRARLRDRAGREATAWFLNEASAGISGLTTELVNSAPKQLGGRISFLLGTLRAIARYTFPGVCVSVDGEPRHEGPLSLATACNGRFFGGGMPIAPEARLDDGLLDVVLVPGFSRARLLRSLPSLYAGTHLAKAGVGFARGRRIELEPLGADPVWIELDGEPLGTLPARIEVLPAALTLFGVPG
jgi:YegS/Rv2252/BmrU family lipid kinase